MHFDFAACRSLTAMFFDQADRFGDKPLLWAKRGGEWQSTSWRETAAQVRALAGGLKAEGLVDGDRVLLVSENRPEWTVADLAVMAAGGIIVPAYTTNTVADHLHLLADSGARFAIVSTPALTERVLAAALQAHGSPTVIAIEPPALAQSPGVPVLSWRQVLAAGAGRDDEVMARVAATHRDDIACLIYTSGTGGAPKGVMLSHGAVLANCSGASQVVAMIGLEGNSFLSFLPLSHAYEHTAGLHFPLSIGAEVYFAESVEHLAANMLEVHPTLMTAVPRLYETMHARILKGVERQGGWKARLFHRAVELGSRRVERGRLPWLLALFDRLLDILVRRKVAARFGGRLKALISGGAPLSYEVGLFFTALGVQILQGYGQTEAAPLISVNLPGDVRLDTVGPPVQGVEVRIADDGEILARGEMVMRGYWNDRQATAQVIDGEGWLHTGDIGELDSGGRIRITDRKKDIIVNSGGDNVSPQRVEGFLTLQQEIAQAMTYGDRRPHLVALIIPAEDWATGWAAAHGKPTALAGLIEDGDFRRAIGAAVDRVNRSLSAPEKIRRFALAAEPFSVDNAMLTPTMKIRRHVIRQVYGEVLNGLYE